MVFPRSIRALRGSVRCGGICALVLWVSAGLAFASGTRLRLPAVFSDNMVLQLGPDAPVWGWASPGDHVTVILRQERATCVAGADGKWQVSLRVPPASGSELSLVLKADHTITLANLLPASPFRTDSW